MKELNDLNGIYQKMYEGKKADKDYDGDGKVESGTAEYMGSKDKAIKKAMKKEAYTVTNADKKGNTPAYQAYKAGKKNVKTGKPMYKAADHLKDDVEISSEVEKLIESGLFSVEEIAKIAGIEIDEAQSSYDKARKAAARRAADRNAARRRGELGGRMERETYTSEGGTRMHHKGYKAREGE